MATKDHQNQLSLTNWDLQDKYEPAVPPPVAQAARIRASTKGPMGNPYTNPAMTPAGTRAATTAKLAATTTAAPKQLEEVKPTRALPKGGEQATKKAATSPCKAATKHQTKRTPTLTTLQPVSKWQTVEQEHTSAPMTALPKVHSDKKPQHLEAFNKKLLGDKDYDVKAAALEELFHNKLTHCNGILFKRPSWHNTMPTRQDHCSEHPSENQTSTTHSRRRLACSNPPSDHMFGVPHT